MDEQMQDVQFEPKYSSSVSIRDVALRICRKQRTIGRCGERGSGISVLRARHDDDDDDDGKRKVILVNPTFCKLSNINISKDFFQSGQPLE